MAVSPKTKADVDKMSQALARIVEEDPSLRVTREADINETHISGQGETHIDVAMERIKRKFGTELEIQLPKVPYKETITSVTRAEYRHKKQTGGHGQYGHVLLRLEPLERGEGIQFGAEVVGGLSPQGVYTRSGEGRRQNPAGRCGCRLSRGGRQGCAL